MVIFVVQAWRWMMLPFCKFGLDDDRETVALLDAGSRFLSTYDK